MVAKKDEPQPERRSVTELLGDWRAAERDTVAAQGASAVAQLALAAAHAAEQAANETEEAARAAIEVATRARVAVEHARRAAGAAAEAAHLALGGAEGDVVRSGQEVHRAESAETAARDRFHDAEARDFPHKDSTE